MSKKTFMRYSWFMVAYNVMVILWGAVVRATGSGAGCGNHWPLCNGEILPELAQLETKIELIHRITSTLDGFLIILLVVFAYRTYSRSSHVFKWALAALAFVLIEGLLGRMLVVQNWVADNVSVMRAVAVSIHLVNTYFLLATLTVTAWLGNKGKQIEFRKMRIVNILLITGITLSIIFSAMGAVTALGDTLFPAESISFDLAKNFSPSNNFLIKLRVIHPIMAILTSSYLFITIQVVMKRGLGKMVNMRGKWLKGVIMLQVLAGGFTILTLAPLFMQILHLFLADVFWISLVLFALESLLIVERVSSD